MGGTGPPVIGTVNSIIIPVPQVLLFIPSTLSVGPDGQPVEFDGKRLRKTMMRKTVDYNSSFINMLHNRVNPLVLILIIQLVVK